jgi:hypothetical protein
MEYDTLTSYWLKACKINSDLFQELLDTKNNHQEIDWEGWFQKFKNQANKEYIENLFAVFFPENNQSFAQKLLELETIFLHSLKKGINEEAVQNVQDIYKIWLECCEQVYQEMLTTPDYQQAYAKFINTFIKDKS